MINMQKAFLKEFGIMNAYLFYTESLTTPACDETVYWFVFTTPVPANLSQIAPIDKHFRGDPRFAGGRGNNRLLQRQNSRTVYLVPYKQSLHLNSEISSIVL
jgi:carbonic anhydrase